MCMQAQKENDSGDGNEMNVSAGAFLSKQMLSGTNCWFCFYVLSIWIFYICLKGQYHIPRLRCSRQDE